MNQELALRDIHLPDSVSWWPLAAGWWLILAVVVLLVLSIILFRKLNARRQLRKQAIIEFNRIEQNFRQHANSQYLASELSSLIRRVCISRFARRDVAGLTGAAWIDFLNTSTASFNETVSQTLIHAPYQEGYTYDSEALIGACKHWITHIPSQRPRGKP